MNFLQKKVTNYPTFNSLYFKTLVVRDTTTLFKGDNMKKLILPLTLLLITSISSAGNLEGSEVKKKCEMVTTDTIYIGYYGLVEKNDDLSKKFDAHLNEVESLAKKHNAKNFRTTSSSLSLNKSSYGQDRYDFSISISAEYAPNSSLTDALLKDIKASTASFSRTTNEICK